MSDPLGLINTQPINPITPAKPTGNTANAPQGPAFKEVLMKNLEQVNKLQQDAEVAVEGLATGQSTVENVMIAKEKADIAFQMLLQVRNKMMDAYEEVKQIRV
jgi:flagellar hook-basal body complex protein FliE